MIYITTIKQRRQINNMEQQDIAEIYKQLYNNINVNINQIIDTTPTLKYPETITFVKEHKDLDTEILLPLASYTDEIYRLCKNFTTLHNVNEMYDTFYIPKRSGGYRKINSPKPELKEIQYKVVEFLQNTCKCLTHNAAFAYVKQRSPKEALAVHQKNKSRWFLKLDIKDFFPSCTLEFIVQQLKKIFPLCFLSEIDLTSILSVCCLNGALPQGAPTSPLITNLLMIPIDYTINKTLYDFNNSHYVYTRYADDILISNKYAFNWNIMQEEIKKILQEQQTPFNIKKEKTRYGNANGRNWNLGLMYNKDLNITVGHKRKERTRAALYNFFRDSTSTETMWRAPQVQILIGEISYLNNIEPEYIPPLISKYEQKFNINFKTTTKYILNNLF